MLAPSVACGLCALFDFRQCNIASVKIVGRGYPTEVKVKGVRLVKGALDFLMKDYSRARFYEATENIFEEIMGEQCKRQGCYYPHFFLSMIQT